MAKRRSSKRPAPASAADPPAEASPAKEPNFHSFRKLIEIFDQERRLLAYEIHDGVVQDIIGAKMLADSLLDSRPDCREDLQPLVKLLRAAIDEARRLVRELRPIVIDEMGVVAALQFHIKELGETHRQNVQFQHDVQFTRLAPMLEGAIFRIVQEALTNARRHSRATQVVVRLTQQDDLIRLEIEDEGVGFDPANVPANRYGLEGIRERARLLGGRAHVRSAPDRGTTIRVELPVERPEPASTTRSRPKRKKKPRSS